MIRYGGLLGTLFGAVLCVQISASVWAAPPLAESSVNAASAPEESQATPANELNDSLSLKTSSVQSLTFSQRTVDSISTAVSIDGQVWTLVLEKHSVRSPDFQLLVQDATGGLTPVEAPPSITYRGHVEEIPLSQVRASYTDGKLNAVIFTEEESYGIQPLADLGADHAPGEHVVYRASDWENRGGFSCGTDEAKHLFDGDDSLKIDLEQPPTRGTGLKITDIGIDVDVEFYQLNGSSIPNTLVDVELVINGVEAIYEAEAQITYEVTTVIIRTAEPDPYTSTNPETLLTNQFQANWNSSPQSFIRRDTAHLFTGKNIDGGVIGIAYLNAICNTLSNAYGLSQSRFTGSLTSRVALTAHELGHNWSCPHCNDPNCSPYPNCCRIMCSGLGGCSGIITSFGTYSANQIIAFRNSRSCLSDLADPRTLPFFEDFPNTTLDAAKWIFNFNGSINTNAVGEPSAANSIELDTAGSELYRDDDLRSNFIQLAGQSNVRFSYYTEHRGVENGEQLVVEYLANNTLWTEINRITSDGVDQSTFDFHTHILPPNAYHNEFRIRFRPEVNETNDDWFVDDVIVSSSCANDAECNDGLHCNGVETCVATVCVPGTPPSCPGELCNENLDECTECVINADCTDNLFCTGAETCDGSGNCQAGTNPCTTPSLPFCVEAFDACVACLVNADCNDDVFCNGAEVCAANVCSSGASPCPGQACNEDSDMCQPPPDIYCVLSSSSAAPSGTAVAEIYLDDVNNTVRSYQATVSVAQTSGTGTVSINCPGGVSIDVNQSDYVFYNNANDFPVANCGQKRVAASLSTGFVTLGAAPVYLGEFLLTVSGDATEGSTFDLTISSVTAQTYLRDGNNVNVPLDVAPPCTLTIAECNPCQLYGDIEPAGGGAFMGDCDVDVDDIGCVLTDFVTPGSCPSADIEPCGGDGDTDSDDILSELAAFAGNYACPDPCP